MLSFENILNNEIPIFTARIWRMGEGTVFSFSVHTATGEYPIPCPIGGHPIPGPGGGYPIPGQGWGGHTPSQVQAGGGGTPSQVQVGIPPIMTGWDTPPPHQEISIVSTCYAAGGVPLAFTQKDFLVKYIFLVLKFLFSYHFCGKSCWFSSFWNIPFAW